jgi:hypothetical protein
MNQCKLTDYILWDKRITLCADPTTGKKIVIVLRFNIKNAYELNRDIHVVDKLGNIVLTTSHLEFAIRKYNGL